MRQTDSQRHIKTTDRESVSLYCMTTCLRSCLCLHVCYKAPVPNERSRLCSSCLLTTGVWSRPLGDSQITWQEAAKAAGPVVNTGKLPSWGQKNILSLFFQAPHNTCLYSFKQSVCKTTDVCSQKLLFPERPTMHWWEPTWFRFSGEIASVWSRNVSVIHHECNNIHAQKRWKAGEFK